MIDRIRRRLTLGYVGILALILALFGVITMFSFWQRVAYEQDQFLLRSARNEAESLLNGAKKYEVVGTDTKHEVAVTYVYLDGPGREPVMPVEAADVPMGLPDEELAKESALTDEAFCENATGAKDPVRVASVPLSYGEGETVVVVQAAQSRRVVLDTVTELVRVLAAVGLGALALAFVGGLYMSRRAMRPVQDSFDRQRAFIADASHELKTPLTLIRADAEVLQRGLDDPDQKELADDLLSETDRMNAVLSDLLLLTRLDAGKVEVRKQSFDLSRTIAEAADRFAARAAAVGVEMVAETPGKLPARGDEERTAQILAALLDNALRFTPGGGRITLAGNPDDGHVRAAVTDTGPGIPAEHLPRIFDRFYRADPHSEARARSGGGTGLGLSIARDLARVQDGELAAGNADDGGAVFTLTLPADTRKSVEKGVDTR